MSAELVRLHNISKKFGSKVVLDHINLTVSAKNTLAVIGSNGCGKSTLLKIIAGLSPVSNGIRNSEDISIGFVPDHLPKLPFYPNEYLMYMGKIQGISSQLVQKKIKKLFDVYAISDSMQKTWIRNLSKGTTQKIAFMQAVLAKPDLLVLDEPLSGLDQKSQDHFVQMLREFKFQGIAMVIACHEKYFVEELADQVFDITNAQLNTNSEQTCMVIKVKINQNSAEMIKNILGVKRIFSSGELVTVYTENSSSDEVLAKILQVGGTILSVNPSQVQFELLSQ